MSLPSTLAGRIAANASDAIQRQLDLPFPTWVDRLRAAPNTLLRSALFGVVKPGRRRYVRELPLPMAGEFALTYTGERLDQSDLDIFFQIIHFARHRPASAVVSFPTRRLLRDIERGTGRTDYQWLHRRLVALSSCGIVIANRQAQRVYSGPILRGVQDGVSGQSAFTLNPILRALFEPAEFTLIDWRDRLALGSKQLAKWVHAFYATHAQPHPIRVSTLKDLCGSEAKDLNDFRRDVKRALEELRSRRLIRSWHIDARDLVHVVVLPTPSQVRHLNRKRTG